MTNPVPDIQLCYEWREGSLPPPHHYEYKVDVRGDQGEIEFSPDYPAENTPVWVEPFNVDVQAVARIVQRFDEEGLLRPTWQIPENGETGGATEWLVIERDGERFSIPPAVARWHEIAKEIIAEVRSLVPEPLWDEVMRRRREYEESWQPA